MTFDAARIIYIHAELSKKHKIEPGFKDEHIINSIIYKMDNKINDQELYPDDYLKAACLFEGIEGHLKKNLQFSQSLVNNFTNWVSFCKELYILS